MDITSGVFLVFLLLSLAVYYILSRRAQNYWLLFISYIFCISWAWYFAVVLLVTTLLNYLLAKRQQIAEQGQKRILWTAIGFNIVVLGFFRLAGFFVSDLETFLVNVGFADGTGLIQLLLPVGLSFYIVENISYQIDVYRGQLEASNDFIDYALYQAYFPKLLAGPIERAADFLPKLAQRRLVNDQLLAKSFTLIVIGAFRKLVIADGLSAAIPWDVFEAPGNFWAGELWGWLFVYGFALYNDFAGYTSLVRGISGLFGIELSLNFQQPYFARTFGEFWNNWHRTLSHWLRDYIYFPTLRSLLRRDRNRRSLPNIVLPPLTTMLVSGLWHGFSLHMLVWGLLHGLYQIGERILSLRGPAVAQDKRPLGRQLLAMGVIFILVMVAWVPFKVEMPIAVQFWKQLLSFGTVSIRYRRLALAVGFVLITLIIDILQRRYQDEVVFLRWPRLAKAAILAVVIFLVIIASSGTVPEPFVYQRF